MRQIRQLQFDPGHPILLNNSRFDRIVPAQAAGEPEIQQVLDIQSEAEGLLRRAEYDLDSLSVLELVGASECSTYDGEFAALALKHGTKLVTMDGKLLWAFPGTVEALSAN